MSKKNKKDDKPNKIKERRIFVQVGKTIQEEDYEPFVLHLAEMVIYTRLKNAKKVRKRLVKKLTDELDEHIDRRFDNIANQEE